MCVINLLSVFFTLRTRSELPHNPELTPKQVEELTWRMTEFSENRIYSESPPPGSGAVRLDDFLNPPRRPRRLSVRHSRPRSPASMRIRGLSSPRGRARRL